MLNKPLIPHLPDKRVLLRRGILTLLALAFMFFLYWLNQVQKPELVTTAGRSFEHAKVVEILQDNLQEDGRRYGEQTVSLQMLSGSKKGETVEATSAAGYLFGAGCTPGMKVIVIQSVSQGISVTSVYNADREFAIYGFVLLFFITLCVIAGKQGIKSSIGLIFTLACIFWLYLPLVFRGFSPFWAAVAVAAVTTFVTMYLIGGPTKKTACAILGTVSGVIIAGAAATIFGVVSGISGYNVSDIENLLFLQESTKLQVGGLLFSGLLISSLGAAIDISISIASTIHEIHENTPALSRTELFSSGMRVGRDLMGSNASTLILAFAGGSITMLVSNYVYDLPYVQVINSYGIGIEIMQAFSGSFGIILSVPIVAAISAFWLGSASTSTADSLEPAAVFQGDSMAIAENAIPVSTNQPQAKISLFLNKVNLLISAKAKPILQKYWRSAVVAVCLLTLTFCGIQFYSAYRDYHNAQKEYTQAAKTAAAPLAPTPEPITTTQNDTNTPEESPFTFDYAALSAQNKDTVGWIRLPGTTLNYPVVQGKDNAYYLTHTFYKNKNRAGAIFLDATIEGSLSSNHSILYGHNMKDGSMFTTLCKYRQSSFWEAHPTLELYTKDEKTQYKIFSVHEASPDSATYTPSFLNQKAYQAYLNKMAAQSIYNTNISVTTQQPTLTLSTCVNDERDMRFVVHAQRI